MAATERAGLQQTLGLFETTLGGIGIILGAGIYVLVGEVAGEAGNAVWASFLMAAIAAVVVGLSYAELASAYPRAGADYEYTRQALGPRAGFVVGWLIVIGNLVAAAAVALGFGRYLDTFIGTGATPIAIGALVVATLIAFFGIRETVRMSVVFTLVEAGGLIFIICVGVPHLGDVSLVDSKEGITGVFGGASLVMFAFIGFEQIATLSEETRDAARVIPKALLISIAVTAMLYLLVAVTAVSVLGWEALSASEAPLASVAEDVLGSGAEDLIAIIALFSTANTMLLLLVAASRLVYSMASTGTLPRFLAWVHPSKHTPVRAIGLSLLVSVGFACSGDVGLVAGATNFAVFVGFAAVSLSLIILRFRHPDVERPFRVPLNIGRLPLLPIVALGLVAFMMANLKLNVLAIGGGLLLSGVVAMEVLSLWRPSTGRPLSPTEAGDKMT